MLNYFQFITRAGYTRITFHIGAGTAESYIHIYTTKSKQKRSLLNVWPFEIYCRREYLSLGLDDSGNRLLTPEIIITVVSCKRMITCTDWKSNMHPNARKYESRLSLRVIKLENNIRDYFCGVEFVQPVYQMNINHCHKWLTLPVISFASSSQLLCSKCIAAKTTAIQFESTFSTAISML